MSGRTSEAAGLSQQEGAPGHKEKQSRLQQWEVPQLGELGHVITTELVKGQNKSARNVTQICTNTMIIHSVAEASATDSQ